MRRCHVAVLVVPGGLDQRGVEALPSQPGIVGADPCLPAGVDDPMPQQQLRHAVTSPHQITAVDASRRSNVKKYSASRASVFTRLPDGHWSFDGAATTVRMSLAVRILAKSYPVGPASSITAAGQGLDPRRHFNRIGAKSGSDNFSGLDIHRMRHHGPGMHIRRSERLSDTDPTRYPHQARKAEKQQGARHGRIVTQAARPVDRRPP